MFDNLQVNLVPVLNRLVELGRVEPFDVTNFVNIVVYYSISAAFLNHSPMKISLDEWQKGLGMIFSLLKTK
jgi:hypothetical protein